MAEPIAVLATLAAAFTWKAAAFLSHGKVWEGAAIAIPVAGSALLLAALATGRRTWLAASSWAWTLALVPVLAWGEPGAVEAVVWPTLLLLYWEVGELYAFARESAAAPSTVATPVRIGLALAAGRSALLGVAAALLRALLRSMNLRVPWLVYLLAALAVIVGFGAIQSVMREESYGDSNSERTGR